MTQEFLLRVQQISSISIRVDVRQRDYLYKEYRKRRFRKDVQEGFYWDVWESDISVPETDILRDSRLCIVGKKVYFKPHVIVHMRNEESYTKYFENTTELEGFLNDPRFNDIDFIKI